MLCYIISGNLISVRFPVYFCFIRGHLWEFVLRRRHNHNLNVLECIRPVETLVAVWEVMFVEYT